MIQVAGIDDGGDEDMEKEGGESVEEQDDEDDPEEALPDATKSKGSKKGKVC